MQKLFMICADVAPKRILAMNGLILKQRPKTGRKGLGRRWRGAPMAGLGCKNAGL
jgi:hypothetical protein